jgi:hypothetical protein
VTRLLLAALLAAGWVAGVLLWRRRAEAEPVWDEPEDGVQGPDPYVVGLG